MLVIFVLLIPMLLGMSAIVIGIGNWFVHAKHLQTKADAGALAGGTAWEFPCSPAGSPPSINAIDQRIANFARLYSGPTATTPTGTNPQVGGVPGTSIHSVLNGPDWYDDDSNPSPSENLDICEKMHLNVKLTEDNSFPLASLMPLFPDIKRKAAVELQEAEGVAGLLPIAARAPEPASAMAIFYNEDNGAILDRKYFVKNSGLSNIPGGLQGWTTENAADPNAQGWASVAVAGATGVVVAISFRGACDTWDPTTNPGGPPAGVAIETTNPCFEDGLGPGAPTYTNVNNLCNQGGSVQVANCYFATGTFPTEAVQSGLHFIRGNPSGGGPAPQLGSAYLSPGGCSGSGYGSGYFTSFPNVCGAVMNASIDAGSCYRIPQGSGWTGPCVNPSTNPTATETRIPANVEVKYTLVYGTGNPDDICDFGNTCDLTRSGSAGSISATGALDMSPSPNKTRYAVALRVRMKNTNVPGRSCAGNNFGGGCEWYFLGSGRVDTEPTNLEIFDDPVQRIFRGNTVNAASIKLLRLKADRSPCTPLVPVDEFAYGGAEGNHPASATSCFVVEMALKGGIATDADNQPFLWNDGVGSSQLGYVDCTATGPQNIVWELMNGCPPLYAPNLFNTNPYCPPANDLFTAPNPGPPFDNGDWPPLRCVKTRPTSQGIDLIKGLNGRFFYPNDPNPSSQPPNTCPSPNGNEFVRGRNYWKYVPGGPPFGYQEDNGSWATAFDSRDPRLVTIFLTTSESFTGSGQNTYPVVGAIAVYITGYGTVSGNGSLNPPVDPCAGPPPSDLDLSGGSGGGSVIWGYLINRAVLSANATGSGDPCNPGGSTQVCVPVLVE